MVVSYARGTPVIEFAPMDEGREENSEKEAASGRTEMSEGRDRVWWGRWACNESFNDDQALHLRGSEFDLLFPKWRGANTGLTGVPH